MVANVSFSPYVQTVADGSFNVSSEGYVQGTAMDDPSARYRLAGGYLSNDETIPMWGGVGITEDIPGPDGGMPPNPSQVLGGKIARALSLTGSGALTGFSVFDQAMAMINTPQSPVPLSASGGPVNFYRFGSNARIALACDPALVDLDGNIITSQVSWDFDLQRLIPFVAGYGPLAISAITWNANVASVTVAANSLATGDDVEISGSDVAAYDGDWTITVVDSTHFTFALPLASDPGDATTGTVNAGGGALNVRILRVSPTNNMTVVYDPATGFAKWNRNGACALVLL